MPAARQCPTCQRQFRGPETFCPRDGNPLVEAPEPPDPRAGEELGGRFVLLRRLGQGGMGVVYLARHLTLSRPYAIKLLLPELARDDKALARFYREARAASAVGHENLVALHDFGRSERGEPFLVMEYVEGRSLSEVLAECREEGLPAARALDISLQVARALRHAHGRGVVHRDIKPDNVLLTVREGVPDFVKVLDFGVARVIGQPPLTRIGEEVVGTPAYMAPELLTSPEAIGPPADLYALGIFLHELLCGTPPFTGGLNHVLWAQLKETPPPLLQRRPERKLPLELGHLCEQLLDKDPARRPDAAGAIAVLEQARALLPPRSLRSLLIARTVILGASRSVHEAETAILPGQRARGASTTATLRLPALLPDIDQVEVEIERIGAMLERAVADLGAATGWAGEARALREQLGRVEESLQGAGLELALCEDRLAEEQEAAQRERDRLRQQVLDAGEGLRVRAPVPAQRRAAIEALARTEQALLALEQGPQASALCGERDRLRQLLQEGRAERLRALRRLCEELLDESAGPAVAEARARAIDLLGRLDEAVAVQEAALLRAERLTGGGP